MGYAIRAKPMLPDDKPKLANTGVALQPGIVASLDHLVRLTGAKSRNALVNSFLRFACDFYMESRDVRDRIDAYSKTERITFAQATARLVSLGLDSLGRPSRK